MSDLISRQAAMNALEQGFKDTTNGIDKLSPTYGLIKATTEIYKCYIGKLPPIQPKRGKWIHHPEIGWGETWLCNQCGEKTTSTVMGKPRANFCPNCGAKMEVNHESN